MANILKGRCPHCKGRGLILRTDPGPDVALIQFRCQKCAAEWEAALSFQRHLRPPQKPAQAVQESFFEFLPHTG